MIKTWTVTVDECTETLSRINHLFIVVLGTISVYYTFIAVSGGVSIFIYVSCDSISLPQKVSQLFSYFN